MEVQEKYLPTKEVRIGTVNAQLSESKTILFRLILSRDEALERGDSKTAEEDEFNMKTMVRKIDYLTQVLDNLGE